jgi:Cysteine-rich CPCC
MQRKRLTCPCCGYRTITQEFSICNVCWWEYDTIQRDYPYCDGGANAQSLRDAQREFFSESLLPLQEEARRKAVRTAVSPSRQRQPIQSFTG